MKFRYLEYITIAILITHSPLNSMSLTSLQKTLDNTLQEAAGIALAVKFDLNDTIDLEPTFQYKGLVKKEFKTNALWVSHLLDAQDALIKNCNQKTIEGGLKLICLFLAELGSIQASTYYQDYNNQLPVAKQEEIVNFCATKTQELNTLMPRKFAHNSQKWFASQEILKQYYQSKK